MSFGDYLQGSVELIVVAGAMAYGAVALRGRLLPGWSGASARLAEVVLGLSLLVVTAELVGVVGLYRPGWVLLATIIVGVGVGLAAQASPARHRAAVAAGFADRDGGGGRGSAAGGRPLGDADPDRSRHRHVPAEHHLAQRPLRGPLRPGPPGRCAPLHRGPEPHGLVLPAELRAAPFGRRPLPRQRLPLAADQHRLDVALPAGGVVASRGPTAAGRSRSWQSRWSSTRTCCSSTNRATPRTTRPGSSSCSPPRRCSSMPTRRRGRPPAP